MTPEPVVQDTSNRPVTRGRGIGWLSAAAMIGALANAVAGTAGALLAERLGGATWYAGWPQAMIVVGTAIAALVISPASRGGGRARALAWGAIAGAFGAAAVVVSAIAGAIVAMLLGSLLFGAGNAVVMLSRYAAAERAAPANRVRALTRLLVATSVGAVLGPLLLEPSDAAGRAVGLPPLAGCFVLGAVGFAVAAAELFRSAPRRSVAPQRRDESSPMTDAAADATADAVAVAAATSAPGRSSTASRRDSIVGIGVLSLANVVMVTVMAVLPVHLGHLHVDLASVGVLISAHIAAMFAPSPLSGALVERWGAEVVACIGAVVLAAAACLATGAPQSVPGVAIAVVLIGLGWNLSLVAGSAVLSRDADERVRLRREGWGEVGMGVAAAGGAAASGTVLQLAGFGAVATAAAVVAVVLLAWAAAAGPARGRP
ncbi:MFS transporter [Agromyces sp. CFH 90414]|uniref:MFS transporter n=1 Tax=Agromyces agglutinans TaxID=2662258 RepID=A0A6I2FBX5_9MICO|nr:MFS transporter [Agromyces agglutinans]MRG61624.1 MFS transporter [Agromyces agglutinans]